MHTLSRGASKHPLDVASFAYDLGVTTGELKSGRPVVEFHVAPASPGLGLRVGASCDRSSEKTRNGEDADHGGHPQQALGAGAGPLGDKILHGVSVASYSRAELDHSLSALRFAPPA